MCLKEKCRFLFKYATRSRPAWFKQTLEKWRSALSGDNDYFWLISIDEDDASMNNPEMLEYLSKIPDLKVCISQSKNKIQAINADMDKAPSDWDILVVVSDDMVPVLSNLDEIIVEDFKKHWGATERYYDGALWYNDGRAGNTICCLTIMGRKLYESFGYIYWPEYKSQWCDNEYTEVCMAMGKITFINRILIYHNWMPYGADGLYNRNLNRQWWDEDHALYKARQANGFPQEYIGPRVRL